MCRSSDKSQREDGTFSREDSIYDEMRDVYTCPAGKTLATTGHVNGDHALRYLGSVPACRACPLKAKCCPNMPARRIVRDVNEAARDTARMLAKNWKPSPRNRAAIARKWRCCSRTSSAFCGLTDLPSRPEREHSSSSRWRQSHKT